MQSARPGVRSIGPCAPFHRSALARRAHAREIAEKSRETSSGTHLRGPPGGRAIDGRAPIWPTSTNTYQRHCLASVDMGQKWPAANFGQCWSIVAQLGPKLANTLGPNQSSVGQMWHLPSWSTKLLPASLNIWPTSARLGRRSNVSRHLGNFRETSEIARVGVGALGVAWRATFRQQLSDPFIFLLCPRPPPSQRLRRGEARARERHRAVVLPQPLVHAVRGRPGEHGGRRGDRRGDQVLLRGRGAGARRGGRLRWEV